MDCLFATLQKRYIAGVFLEISQNTYPPEYPRVSILGKCQYNLVGSFSQYLLQFFVLFMF